MSSSPRIKKASANIKVYSLSSLMSLEDWIPESTTVKHHYDKEVLIKLKERSEKKAWFHSLKGRFICIHSTLSVDKFLDKKHDYT